MISTNIYNDSMSFYESERAAHFMGVPGVAESVSGSQYSVAANATVASVNANKGKQVRGRERLVDAVDRYLTGPGSKREVAKSVYDAVEVTQVLDVRVEELEVGRMRFHRVPGTEFSSGGLKRNVEAFWSFSTEINESPQFLSHLILVGSVDGETGSDHDADSSKYDKYDYPSTPGFITNILDQALQLEVDYEDLEYSSGQYAPMKGDQAFEAFEITERGRARGSRRSWVRNSFPSQRVIAIVNDVKMLSETEKVVLARPVIIESTI